MTFFDTSGSREKDIGSTATPNNKINPDIDGAGKKLKMIETKKNERVGGFV